MMRKVERAIGELKAGEPVLLIDGDDAALVFSVEGLESPSLPRWADVLAPSSITLTLTQKRLESLGVSGADERGGALTYSVTGASRFDALADRFLRMSVQQATTAADLPAVEVPGAVEQAGLAMVRQGRLLPAVVSLPVAQSARKEVDAAAANQELLKVNVADVLAFEENLERNLQRVSEARVPLDGAEHAHFVLFREGSGLREHVALVIGDPANWPDPVPVRMHSACLTGDLFGSLRCDCGEQLRGAVQSIAEEGGGVLLYLAQEGRDIGLANKLRAYSLQDQGLDTLEADQVLGFAEDERRYGVAVSMLKSLGIDRVDLLTNNPIKLQAMRDGGIEVGRRRELYGRVTPYNRRYLTAKAERAGHLLGSTLKLAP